MLRLLRRLLSLAAWGIGLMGCAGGAVGKAGALLVLAQGVQHGVREPSALDGDAAPGRLVGRVRAPDAGRDGNGGG